MPRPHKKAIMADLFGDTTTHEGLVYCNSFNKYDFAINKLYQECRNIPSEDEKEVPSEEITESGISCSENTETLPIFYEDWSDTLFQVVIQKLLSSDRTKETKAEPGKADASEKFMTSKKNDEKSFL